MRLLDFCDEQSGAYKVRGRGFRPGTNEDFQPESRQLRINRINTWDTNRLSNAEAQERLPGIRLWAEQKWEQTVKIPDMTQLRINQI